MTKSSVDGDIDVILVGKSAGFRLFQSGSCAASACLTDLSKLCWTSGNQEDPGMTRWS